MYAGVSTSPFGTQIEGYEILSLRGSETECVQPSRCGQQFIRFIKVLKDFTGAARLKVTVSGFTRHLEWVTEGRKQWT